MSLIRNIKATTEYRAEFAGQISLNPEIKDCDILLMTSQEEFTLAEAWEGSLRNYLGWGGIILGEYCGVIEAKEESPFQRLFRDMAD